MKWALRSEKKRRYAVITLARDAVPCTQPRRRTARTAADCQASRTRCARVAGAPLPRRSGHQSSNCEESWRCAETKVATKASDVTHTDTHHVGIAATCGGEGKMTTHYSPTGDSIACGLPSPGSRLQSVCAGSKPATCESVSTTKDKSKVTCKRCRRSYYFRNVKQD